MSDIQRSTLRYHRELLSRDLDDNGTVDIPVEIDDGGTLQTPMDKRLSFLLWKDYTSMAGGNSKFGVYDSEYNIFMELPESMHGSILIRSNQSGTGWLICNAEGTTVYCEMRVVDPADNAYRRRQLSAHCKHWQPAAASPRCNVVLWIEPGFHQPEHGAAGIKLIQKGKSGL